MAEDWICSQCGLMHSEHGEPEPLPAPIAALKERCAEFKANHDMAYSADDLAAFVIAEFERAGHSLKQGAPS